MNRPVCQPNALFSLRLRKVAKEEVEDVNSEQWSEREIVLRVRGSEFGGFGFACTVLFPALLLPDVRDLPASQLSPTIMVVANAAANPRNNNDGGGGGGGDASPSVALAPLPLSSLPSVGVGPGIPLGGGGGGAVLTAQQVVTVAVRLRPSDEIKSALLKLAAHHSFSSCWIASVVGSLAHVRVRLASFSREHKLQEKGNDDASADQFLEENDNVEICSLVGTLSGNGKAHLHISCARHDGSMFGGHLMSGKVYTTAEIVLQGFSKQQPDGITFERKHDPATGFEELSVSPTCKAK